MLLGPPLNPCLDFHFLFLGLLGPPCISVWTTNKIVKRKKLNQTTKLKITLFSGGRTDSASALQAVVQRLRNDKTIRIISVGIGDAQEAELASISGNPGYVFMVNDYSELAGIVPDILSLICEIDEEFKSL